MWRTLDGDWQQVAAAVVDACHSLINHQQRFYFLQLYVDWILNNMWHIWVPWLTSTNYHWDFKKMKGMLRQETKRTMQVDLTSASLWRTPNSSWPQAGWSGVLGPWFLRCGLDRILTVKQKVTIWQLNDSGLARSLCPASLTPQGDGGEPEWDPLRQ